MDFTIDTGTKEYSLNGAVKVHFNPTDTAFAEKVIDVFSVMEAKQKEYRQDMTTVNDYREVFAVARKWDAEMREILDKLFDVPVCQALFGDMNIYAMADGLPVWMNLLFAIMDEISVKFVEYGKAVPEKLRAFVEKYNKE